MNHQLGVERACGFDGFEDVDHAAGADAEGLKRIIREHVNTQTLALIDADGFLPESGASIDENWIFRLKDGMGDMHWVIVPRAPDQQAVQEIT